MYYISVVQKPSAYQDWFRYEEFVFHQGIALLKNSGTQGQVYLIHIVFNILVWGNFKLSSKEPQKNCVSCSTFNGSYPGSKSEIPITNIPHRYQIYTSLHI